MKRSTLFSVVLVLACILLCTGCLSTAKPPVASIAPASSIEPAPRKRSWTDPKTGAAMSSIRTTFTPR